MKIIPRHSVQCHADFENTALGRWARSRDDDALTPGGRHVQRLTGLPARVANLLADLNGLGCSR